MLFIGYNKAGRLLARIAYTSQRRFSLIYQNQEQQDRQITKCKGSG